MREELEQIKKLSELQLVEYFQDGVIARDHSFYIENDAFKVQFETNLKRFCMQWTNDIITQLFMKKTVLQAQLE